MNVQRWANASANGYAFRTSDADLTLHVAVDKDGRILTRPSKVTLIFSFDFGIIKPFYRLNP